MTDVICSNVTPATGKSSPIPPPVPPRQRMNGGRRSGMQEASCGCAGTSVRDAWDRLFDEAYGADVSIRTDNGGVVYAHSSVLAVASPVMKNMLNQRRIRGRRRSISIRGVPPDAVRVFVRFLYSACYEEVEMNEFVLHLLVLSHAFVVPPLKNLCERYVERSRLFEEDAVDIFQIALLCDASRLALFCHRFILKNFKIVTQTEGWEVMKRTHPMLEKEILVSKIYEESLQEERRRKMEERKIYIELYEAMDALVHICRDGCRTIGPYDKRLKKDEAPCGFEACRGLELLVRHLSTCKMRVLAGCVHCNRMWQLLELHSRLCSDSEHCRVPLCRNFKERMKKQSKEEMKWRILARNMLIVKSPSISSAIAAFAR